MDHVLRVSETPLPGLGVTESDQWEDRRGTFMRCFCERDLASVIGHRRIVQVNHSITKHRGAVRGLHFQHPPSAEMKLVRCLRGKVWDVAADLRAGSPTFLHWHAVELSGENHRMIVIPEGFAHGFQVLTPDSELLYLHTAFYAPAAESGVAWNEPHLNISWPLAVTDLSERDASHPLLAPDFRGVVVGNLERAGCGF